MRQTVIIVGGGVAGLTAAHELIERDFEVHVVERRDVQGGKASSGRLAGGLPTEHGFRFFPGWYRHLPDTLRRIPYKGRRELYEGRTVFDNLTCIDSNLLLWYDRDPAEAPMHLPRSLDQLRAMSSFFLDMRRLDLAPAEMSFFFSRLATFLTTPEAERRQRYQNMTWWQFLEAEDKSRGFKDLISATTRTMVAAKATEASAYSICNLALRTLSDAFSSVDRVLNGPTSEKWIEPWVDYLEGRGVQFHNGWELTDIHFKEREPLVASIEYGCVQADNLRRLRRLLAPMGSNLRALVALNPGDAGAGTKRHALSRSFHDNAKAFKQLLDAIGLANGATGELAAFVPRALIAFESLWSIAKGAARLHEQAWLGEHVPKTSPQLAASKVAEDAKNRASLVMKLSQLGLPSATVSRSRVGQGSPFTWALELFELLNSVAQIQKIWTDGPPPPDSDSNGQGADGEQFARNVEQMRGYVDTVFDAAVMARMDDIARNVERGWNVTSPPAQADYFVMALPVEQMAYHVNRSMTAKQHDPELEKIVQLADHVDWMAGIQFYLREGVDLGRGHLVSMDSEWGLTAIEQSQFWDDLKTWPDGVQAVISVDISAWDKRGRFVQKEAFNCTDIEIASEVWQQLRTALSSDAGRHRLQDHMLIGGKLTKGESYNIDDSIVDVSDRRKQGAYERARSARASATAEQPQPFADTLPYVWGPRLRYNVEPLLINRVGSHALRPTAKTKISNLFLASDYVKTQTDLACMEGANEAARHAVNALLLVSGVRERPCEVWDFGLPSGVLKQLTAMANWGTATQLAGEATKAAGKAADVAMNIATRTMGLMRGFWEKR
jgi:uncharacterized protein with NAD-binding domain and iron-sulfur cluster